MKRIRSLRATVVCWIFIILLGSAIFTGACIMILYELNILSLWHFSPFTLPLIALLASMLIGTAVSAFVSKSIMKPISQLIEATKQVAKGDFSVRVPPIGNETELGKLICSFNSMTEELSGTEMFKKDFIDIFSHEFKTPIVSIRGFAKQLKNKDLSPEEREEYIDIIISESERMSKMSGNILLLTKLENQQFIGDKTDFLLDEQLRDCILLLENQWQKKNIEWQLELDEVNYFGNEELLTQLWVNLLNNAIKYSWQNGAIKVGCHLSNNNVTVIISDNGAGIDKEALSHIFDKFYQADTSHSAEGNGLGLSIVRRIVELSGGHITVESALGQGTSFYVDLPVEKQETKKQENKLKTAN